jgi:hypothetical protein
VRPRHHPGPDLLPAHYDARSSHKVATGRAALNHNRNDETARVMHPRDAFADFLRWLFPGGRLSIGLPDGLRPVDPRDSPGS